MDGTIIETDEANFLAYKEAIRKVKNVELGSQNTERFTRGKLKYIIPSLKNEEYEKIIEKKNDVYIKYLHKTKTITFTLGILKKYSQTHCMILTTNSHKLKANLILEYYGLLTIFDYKFYKEDYKNKNFNKYEYMLNHLNIIPNDVIIFENEELEIDMAISLGVPSKNIINI